MRKKKREHGRKHSGAFEEEKRDVKRG